jgi:hypothetical protein
LPEFYVEVILAAQPDSYGIDIGSVAHLHIDDIFIPWGQPHIPITMLEMQSIPFFDIKALMKAFVDVFGRSDPDCG